MQENQSFSLWIISTLFDLLHECGFTYPKPEVLSRMSSSLSSAMVGQSTVAHQMLAYLVTRCREAVLNHVPPLSYGQRYRLLSTSPFSTSLFDPQVLERVMEEFQNDASRNAIISNMAAASSNNRRSRMPRGAAGPLHQANMFQSHLTMRNQPDFYAPPSAGVISKFDSPPVRGSRFLSGRRRVRLVGRIRRARGRKDFQS